MTKSILNKILLLTAILQLNFTNGFSCSTYKVTVGGTTMYGMNYDAWFTSPRIWFETTGYGAAFTGANFQGGNDLTPQAGMNEYGLSFGTLATATPQNGKVSPNKKQITSRSKYLKNILHTCKTVEDVRNYIDQYDHSSLSNDVFLYTEKSGNYLIVEPYTMTSGNDNKYVLSNFCPSTITDYSKIKQQRYINGSAFLNNKIDTSLAFCTALSDTMHVCRKKVGDGTLLTSIWNLNDGVVHLYFYHDYKHQVQFDVAKELSKGDHSFEIVKLFPENSEFNKLLTYKTPDNSNIINKFIWFCFALFLFSFPYFLISYFRNRKSESSKYKLLLSILSLFMASYMLVLLIKIDIFYFPAPYKSYSGGLIDLASYLPFVILLLFIPLLIANKRIIANNVWKKNAKFIFTINTFAYLVLIVLFTYWGFFNILS